MMEFKARLVQYYKDNPEWVDEFNAMWEFMRDC
jgi:hypothetical protein